MACAVSSSSKNSLAITDLLAKENAASQQLRNPPFLDPPPQSRFSRMSQLSVEIVCVCPAQKRQGAVVDMDSPVLVGFLYLPLAWKV